MNLIKKLFYKVKGKLYHGKWFSSYDRNGSYLAYWDEKGKLHKDYQTQGYHNSKL
jgi:hypothetical protein